MGRVNVLTVELRSSPRRPHLVSAEFIVDGSSLGPILESGPISIVMARPPPARWAARRINTGGRLPAAGPRSACPCKACRAIGREDTTKYILGRCPRRLRTPTFGRPPERSTRREIFRHGCGPASQVPGGALASGPPGGLGGPERAPRRKMSGLG